MTATAAPSPLLVALVEDDEALRDASLKKRVWFAIGEPVRVVAVGRGFTVSSEGVALSPGLEGQAVKVRTESGRTVTGLAAGQRRVEVAL